MSKAWQVYAQHILATAQKISAIKQRGDISQDSILYDATLRNLQTLCEATQHLPGALKTRYAAIPWRDIAGFRNILVHNYLGDVDPAAVAAVVENDLPALVAAVDAMLRSKDQRGK